MATRMDTAIGTLVATFYEYAGKDGDKNTLNKKELKELIKKEVTVGPKLSGREVQGLIGELDRNGDDQLNFQEYMTLLGIFVVHYHEALTRDR